jgi:O-antigen/teichoic acid export membrane protein
LNTRHQLVANVLAQGLARVLSIVTNLMLILVVARLMGTEAFGRFSYVLVFITVGATLADLGTTALLARGLALLEGPERAHYLGNYIVLRGALAALVMAGCVAAALMLQHDGTQGALLIGALGLPVLASRFFEPIFQVLGRPWLSLWPNLAFGASQLVVVGLVLASPTMSVSTLTALFVASNTVYTGVAVALMLRHVRPDWTPNRALLAEILKLALPMGVGALFTTLAIRLDVFVLERLHGPVALGQYSAAYRILDLAVFFAVTLTTPLIPILSREIRSDRAAALARSRLFVQGACALALPLAIIVPTIATELVTAIFGAQYGAAAAPLSVLAWNVLPVMLALIGTAVNLANGEVKHAYWVAPSGALVAVALNLALVPAHGALGAAWAALGTQTALLAGSHYYTFTRFGNMYEPRAFRRIAACCALLVVALWLLQPLGPVWAAVLAGAAYAGVALASGTLPLGAMWRTLIEGRAARRRPVV